MSLVFWDDQDGNLTVDPVYCENEWDTAFLGGVRVPGKVSVKCLPSLSIDKKKPGGSDGLRMTITGYLPGPVDIEVLIWTRAQWEKFQELAPKIWRKPNTQRKGLAADAKEHGWSVQEEVMHEAALQIKHPAVNVWGVDRVVLTGVGAPEPGPIPQSVVIHLKAMEYVEPTSKAKTRSVTYSKAKLDDHIAGDPKHGAKPKPSETDTGPTGQKAAPARGPY